MNGGGLEKKRKDGPRFSHGSAKKLRSQTSILLEELRHGRYQLAFTFSFTQLCLHSEVEHVSHVCVSMVSNSMVCLSVDS